MKSIATQSPWKCLVLGILWMMLPSVFWYVTILHTIYEKVSPWHEYLLLVALTWPCLAGLVRHWRVAMDKSLYIRIGKEGIAFRAPVGLDLKRALFAYRIEERTVPWSEIENWGSSTTESKAGYSISDELKITTKKEVIEINSFYFKERAPEIIRRGVAIVEEINKKAA